jgi:hypothetical protein
MRTPTSFSHEVQVVHSLIFTLVIAHSRLRKPRPVPCVCLREGLTMQNPKRDLNNPQERQADLEDRLKEKGLDCEGRPLERDQTQKPRVPLPPD